MKYTKSIILVLAIIININVKSQENKPFNENSNQSSKNIHEISYSLKAALGYSFLRNFNSGFNLGVQANMGYGLRFDTYNGNSKSIIEFADVQIFTRNLFLKNKSYKHFYYDLGGYSALSIGEDFLLDFGISISVFYGFNKIKIGQIIRTSFITANSSFESDFPHFSFKPLIIRYKF